MKNCEKQENQKQKYLKYLKHRVSVKSTENQNQIFLKNYSALKTKKNHIKKKLLNGYSKTHELKLVTIGLASPEKIRFWAEKELPNGKIFGEVTNANTFHYRTFKPSKGGLFCERIFGPIKDFECACGKRQRPTALESKKILEHEQTTRYFCPNCDVEYTWSLIRRYQLGYIKLNAPVAHLWYFKTNPSYLSILFDMKRKQLESIIYCTETITIENMWKSSDQTKSLNRSPTDLYLSWQKFFNIGKKMKKYQIVYKNKKQKQKQKKMMFRDICIREKILHRQINWSTFDNNNLSSRWKTFSLPMQPNKVQSDLPTDQNFPSTFYNLPAKKTDLFKQIAKQKKKKFMYFLFQQFWKNFLKKTYKDSVGFTTSQYLFSENFFQEVHGIFKFFLLYSAQIYPFQSSEVLSIFSISAEHAPFHFQMLPSEQEKRMKEFEGVAQPKKLLFFCPSIVFFQKIKNKKLFHYTRLAQSAGNSHTSENDLYGLTHFIVQKRPHAQLFQTSSVYFGANEFHKDENKQHFFDKKIQKKKFFQSVVFLLKFGMFFAQQKNKKIEVSNSFSREDFLFLMNLIPSLKKISGFQNFKYLAQGEHNFKKLHSFLSLRVENFLKKNKIMCFLPHPKHKNTDLFGVHTDMKRMQSFFCEWPFSAKSNGQKQLNLLTIPTSDAKMKNTETNLSYLEKSLNLQQSLSAPAGPQNFGFISSSQLFNMVLNFQKILSFLKSSYEIDFFSTLFFCLHEQKISEKFFTNNFKENVCFEKNIDKERFIDFFEILFQESKLCFMFEKILFEYFSLFLFFQQSGLASPLHFIMAVRTEEANPYRGKSNCADHLFFLPSQISQLQNQRFVFLSFQILCFCFLNSHSYKAEKKLGIPKNSEIMDQPSFFSKTKKQSFGEKKLRIRIFNKPFVIDGTPTNRKKRKKQLQNEQFQKFLSFDFAFCSEKSKNKNTSIRLSSPFKSQKRRLMWMCSVSQKAVNQNNAYGIDVELTNSSREARNPSVRRGEVSGVSQTKRSRPSCFSLAQKKNSQQNTKDYTKNTVLTIAYNHTWKNDADWKYFVYYNSFAFHEFEDIPIFLYNSLSYLKGTGTICSQEKFNLSANIGTAQKTGVDHKKSSESFSSFLSWSFESAQKNFDGGAGILERLLKEYTSVELRKMTKQHQILLPRINQAIQFLKQNTTTKKQSLKIQKYLQKREHIIRRLKFLRKFSRKNSNPSFMILRNLPVLPPDLRPILKLQNQIAASDLNRFYQRIIYRNDRLKKFSKDSATNQSFEIKYAQRLLQEAVDNLIQNGKGGVKPETNSRGQPLKSLSEILKGKQGRFRQYLLGKRVDYSGRSVIVVGPQLRLYECGIPKEMALELFLPFLIQHILQYKLAQTVIGAKNLLKSDSTLTFHLLHKVMKNIPVLLNRAPTLHRLGFQAFIPKLIEGRAILLHPMVCPAFNADFDGDQMAVHIPLTVEARTEAWKFMLSMNNLMNSATGEPVVLPSQDMVLGCYYLTTDFYSKFPGIQLKNFSRKLQSFSPDEFFMQEFEPSFEKNFLFLCAEDRSAAFLKKKAKAKSYWSANEVGNRCQKQAQYNSKNNVSSQHGITTLINQNKSFLFFKNFNNVITAYQRKEIFLHTPVWVRWNAHVDFGNDFSKPVEIRLQTNGFWEQIQPKYTTFYNNKNQPCSKFIRTTSGRILMNLMIQQCINEKLSASKYAQ